MFVGNVSDCGCPYYDLSACVACFHLPAWSVTWQSLKDEFSKVGAVAHVDIATYPDGKSKGYGFVKFARAEDAHKAVGTLVLRVQVILYVLWFKCVSWCRCRDVRGCHDGRP